MSDKVSAMVTTVRGFVREFAEIRRRADAGEVIHVRGRRGMYVFKPETLGKGGLLGCCVSIAPKKGSKAGPLEPASSWEAGR